MGGFAQIIRREIEATLSTEEGERRAQLEILRSTFIPWLATLNSDDQPIARVARTSELPAESRPLVDRLVNRRLLVRDVRGSDPVVQVAHESLLRRWDLLQNWLREDAEPLKEIERIEQAAFNWTRSGRKAAWLIGGERLQAAKALTLNPRFSRRLQSVDDFLTVSREAERRTHLRWLATSAIVTAIAVASVYIGVIGPARVATQPPLLRAVATTLDETTLVAGLRQHGAFELTRNPSGIPYPSNYQSANWNGAAVVVDAASGLVWQRDGSPAPLDRESADAYISDLNLRLFAGLGDWRLPTVDEALSLLQKTKRADDSYLHPAFGERQRYVWTGDRNAGGEHWSLDFDQATVGEGVTRFDSLGRGFVLAVHSGIDRFSQVDMSKVANLPWAEAGILFYQEPSRPPRGMTRSGVPFWLLGDPKAVFLTAAVLSEHRPTEATVDVAVRDVISAHVLVSAGWLSEVFNGETVGTLEFQFDNRVVQTPLVGWKTIRESWTAYEQPQQFSDSKSVSLTNFFREHQERDKSALAIIDMLTIDFENEGIDHELKRIALRDTSRPKPWRDPRTNSTVMVDPGLAFMGITLKTKGVR